MFATTSAALLLCVLLTAGLSPAQGLWSMRRLSPRTLPGLLSRTRLVDQEDLSRLYFGEMEATSRLGARLDGLLSTDKEGCLRALTRVLEKDFAAQNVMKSKDTVLVDTPATIFGRNIFSFKASVRALKDRSTVLLDLRTADPPKKSLLFWSRRSPCRVIVTATATDQHTILKLRVSSAGMSERDLQHISEYVFDALVAKLNTEIKIAKVRQKWLEKSRVDEETSERERNFKKLKDMLEPDKINRLTTGAAGRPGGGASSRFAPSSSLQERRSPPRSGG